MPQIDAGLKGNAPAKHGLKVWWDRGYELHGAGKSVTCMLCAATVADTKRDADGKPYFELHDEWHEALASRDGA